MMIKKRQTILFSILIFMSYGQLFASSCPSPSAWMEGLNQRVIDAVSIEASDEKKAELVGKVFNPNLDVEMFTKKIIGRAYWKEASPTERKALQKNIYHVMLEDYTDAIVHTLAKKPTIHRVKAGDRDNMSAVTVAFHTKRDKILLAIFSLKCVGSHWKIYDISVQGVRLSDLQHEKFKSVLRSEGVKGLNQYLLNADHQQE